MLGSSYFHTIFLRTFGIAALVTLLCVVIGAPEAYILSRMRDPWRSIFLLVILAPLLVSVVVRAFGWSMLLGANGLVNQAFGAFGIGPYKLLYTDLRDRHRAGARDAAVHGDSGVDRAAEARSADGERRAVADGLARHHAAPHRVAASHAGHSVGQPDRVRPVGERLRDSRPARRTPPEDGGDRRLRRIPARLNWPLGATIALLLLVANLVVMLTYNRVVERRYTSSLG